MKTTRKKYSKKHINKRSGGGILDFLGFTTSIDTLKKRVEKSQKNLDDIKSKLEIAEKQLETDKKALTDATTVKSTQPAESESLPQMEHPKPEELSKQAGGKKSKKK